MAKNLTPQEKQMLASEIANGQTYDYVKAKYKCSSASIARIVKGDGLSQRKEHRRNESSITPFRNRAKVSSESFIYSAF